MFGGRYPYMAGAMAQGISSVEMVAALAGAGLLASFGAAGLSLQQIEQGVRRLQKIPGSPVFAVNLIHSPNEPTYEFKTVELLLRLGVGLIEASAYLKVSDALILYRAKGLFVDTEGYIRTRHRVIAKVSRPEVLGQFLSAAPAQAMARLLQKGLVSEMQARLMESVPLADAVTVEADSGGHTDNRPAVTLLPSLLVQVRERENELRAQEKLRKFFLAARHNEPRPGTTDYGGALMPVGLAGGIATPEAVSAAFAMGAHFVVTGTINQACIEAGTSPAVKNYLAEAEVADTVMAPAADMFEMGVKVQVLKRRTLFPMRAAKLYQIYQAYPSYEQVPADQRAFVEGTLLKKSYASAWQDTVAYFEEREPAEIARGNRDLKHQMALVFRAYLGQTSKWAISGVPERGVDYQIWCGPAMAAFNRWTRGTFMERPDGRRVAEVALNLLFGSAVLKRLNGLRDQGHHFAGSEGWTAPRPLAEIEAFLQAH